MDNADPGLGDGQRQRGCLSPAVAVELRSARRRLGLSFRSAARRTGVSAGNLCKLEHGQRAPSFKVAEALVGGLGLEPGVAAALMAEARHAGRSWRPAR
jgi:transcriptional regulator with XRE-family HTH domain